MSRRYTLTEKGERWLGYLWAVSVTLASTLAFLAVMALVGAIENGLIP